MIFRKSGVNGGAEDYLDGGFEGCFEGCFGGCCEDIEGAAHFLHASSALEPWLLLSYGMMD
jgi:hypothetical protein